jgi:ribosomal-protein-alanine N-acetyltransferase
LPLASKIATDRLVLRAPRTSDVAELRALMRRNARYLQPWQPAPLPGVDPASLAEVTKNVARWRRLWARDQGYTFLVTLRAKGRGAGGAVIGRLALTNVARGAWQNAHLGYFIDQERQGEGLTTEAVRAATAFAFDALGLHRVQAAVMPRNAASLRVLDKAGFRREGVSPRFLQIAGKWEDHVIFAVTCEEYATSRGGRPIG